MLRILAVILLVLATGCVSPLANESALTQDATTAGEGRERVTTFWRNGTVLYGAGVADGPYAVGGSGGGGRFQTYENATRIVAVLSITGTSPADDLRLVLTHWSGESYAAGELADGGDVQVEVEDPQKGTWTLSVRPVGVVVNAQFTLSVSVTTRD